jgi:hypothetical protein
MRWLFLVVVLGCAAKKPGPPGQGSGSAAVPIAIEGRYALRSELDLSTRLPGGPGEVVRVFVDATDDPDDPARFLVDAVIAEIPDAQVVAVLRDVEPLVIGYLSDRLHAIAPQLVARLRAVGAALDRASRHFDTVEELEIARTGRATHAIRGIRIDGTELAFRDHGLPDASVANIPIAVDTQGGVAIGAHELALPYGKLLRLALDGAIIPAADPHATNMFELLRDSIDCGAVGAAISDALGLNAPAVFAAACTSALVDAARAVDTRLDAIADAPIDFELSGTARGVVRDNQLDALDLGVWSGSLRYGGADTPLATATFTGTRI